MAVSVHRITAQVTNLGIAPATGGQSILYWPASTTNYVLQSAANLAAPNWVTVTQAITVTACLVTNTPAARFFRLVPGTNAPTTADGMALIDAGAFIMGDTLDDETDAVPVIATISAFYIDTNLVSYGKWQSVYNWATNNGYSFDNPGLDKASNHPVQTVNWFDSVKWCNARSQQAGLPPVYFTDAGLKQVYTKGDTNNVFPNWSAAGYRLPTEAEWEQAARGGLVGQRFPWGNTISEIQANYFSTNRYSYDLGPYSGANTNFYNNVYPNTSPVGSFAPNGYGLYDVAGNVWEWCWDWYVPYYAGGSDPRGPTAQTPRRVDRGGYWGGDAFYARTAYRDSSNPIYASANVGFRCARGL